MSKATRRLVVVGTSLYLGFLAVLVAMAGALSNGKVLAEGHFVDAVDHDVLRVRVLDRFTMYTDKSVAPLGSDLLNSFALMAVAGIALLAFVLALAGHKDRHLAAFFLLLAGAATFLAFDEQYELIDSLAYNVPSLYVPDIVVYAPPAALFALWFRRILTASRRALTALVIGGGLFVSAQLIDRLPHDRFEGIEEKLEVVATLVLAGGLVLLALHHLVRLTQPERAVKAPAAADPSREDEARIPELVS